MEEEGLVAVWLTLVEPSDGRLTPINQTGWMHCSDRDKGSISRH
jgi:hypothetical protein